MRAGLDNCRRHLPFLRRDTACGMLIGLPSRPRPNGLSSSKLRKSPPKDGLGSYQYSQECALGASKESIKEYSRRGTASAELGSGNTTADSALNSVGRNVLGRELT